MSEAGSEIEKAVDALLGKIRSRGVRLVGGTAMHPQTHPPRVLLLDGDVGGDCFESLIYVLKSEDCRRDGVVVFEGYVDHSDEGYVTLQFYLLRARLRVKACLVLGEDDG